jgi:sugar/nucleoside kinase (ribokinase family)
MKRYLEHKSIDVLGIGNAIVDVVANVKESFLKANNLSKGVMRLISEEEAAKLSRMINAVKISSGGSAANTIAGLAALGNSVAFIGKVKNDDFGNIFENDLKNLGVIFNTKKEDYGFSSTAVCIVLTTSDAHRTMNTCLGVAGNLSPDDINEELVASSSIIYLEGYLWDQQPAKNAFLKAIDIAHKNKGKVALSLSDPFCVERHRIEFLNLIQNKIDILFANEIEILFLFETMDFDSVIRNCKESDIIIAITRSEKGSIIITDNKEYIVEAERTEVVDSTGAGDLYAAGFLNGLIKDKDIYSCGKMGSILAAEVISHFGARPNISLNDLLKSRGF